MVRFEQIGQLHWLWAVPALLLIVLFGARAGRAGLGRFATSNLVGMVTAHASVGRRGAKVVMVLAALVALVAAMIDPRWGVTYEEVRQRGVDIFVVVDVSRSMLAEDAAPNRLDRARRFILDLVDRLGGDRVGLVASAGTASVRCPLTSDYGALRLALSEVSPHSETRGGSRLGDAIRLAADSFTDDVPDSKAIIVFTDGEDHDSDPEEAAVAALEERGILVFTVGIGDDDEGARIPVEVDGQRIYLTHEGQEVWSRMDAEGLRRVALAGGGAFIPVETRTVDMAEVFEDHIAPMTRRELGTAVRKHHHAQYQWLAGLALALLIVDGLVGTRRPLGVRGRVGS